MKNMVNVSEGVFLAFHGLALIVKNYPKRMNVKSMAEELHASEAHIAKIFQKLSKNGIVDSVRGPAGGFQLRKTANKINFLEIYEIIEGKVELKGCPFGKMNCAFETCIFSNELNRISQEIYDFFKNLKLRDLQKNN